VAAVLRRNAAARFSIFRLTVIVDVDEFASRVFNQRAVAQRYLAVVLKQNTYEVNMTQVGCARGGSSTNAMHNY
jgi:hypothetical protein